MLYCFNNSVINNELMRPQAEQEQSEENKSRGLCIICPMGSPSPPVLLGALRRTWDEGTAPSPPPHPVRVRGRVLRGRNHCRPPGQNPGSITVVPPLHSFQFRAKRVHWHEGWSARPHCADEQADGPVQSSLRTWGPRIQRSSCLLLDEDREWGHGGPWPSPLTRQMVLCSWEARGCGNHSATHACVQKRQWEHDTTREKGRREDGREEENFKKKKHWRKMKDRNLGTAWFLLDVLSSSYNSHQSANPQHKGNVIPKIVLFCGFLDLCLIQALIGSLNS